MYYTYLIKCIPENKFYYGSSYKRDANPSQLWDTYFTSSRIIKQKIKEYGLDAFSYEVRKVFTDSKAARDWEQKVLRRMKVVKSIKWYNRTDRVNFTAQYGEDNPMKKEKNKQKLRDSMNNAAIERGFASWSEYMKINNPGRKSAVKVGLWKKGRVWVSDPVTRQNKMILPSELIDYTSKGFIRGKLSRL